MPKSQYNPELSDSKDFAAEYVESGTSGLNLELSGSVENKLKTEIKVHRKSSSVNQMVSCIPIDDSK